MKIIDSTPETTNQALPYRMYLPTNYENKEEWPLIVFLHGSGERGNDPNKLDRYGLTSLIKNRTDFPFIVLAPLCPAEKKWEAIYNEVMSLVDNISQAHKVNQKQMYLTGMSMGGAGVWHYGVTNPNKFAAYAPIAGYMHNPDEVIKLKDKPIWAAHGKQDKAIPFKKAEEIINKLTGQSNKVVFKIYETEGHEVCTNAYKDDDLYKWFLEQIAQ
jgi:predicted peptidase